MFSKLNQAITVIQQDHKSDQDIDVICEGLKLFSYFDIIKFHQDFEDKLKQCAKLLKYKQYKQGETIFLEGDRGSHFFLIFCGKVSVLMSKSQEEIKKEKELIDTINKINIELDELDDTAQETAKKTQIKAKAELSKKYQHDIISSLLKLGNSDINKQLNEDNILTIKQICELKHTQTFGELFMITNQIRNATVVATCDVKLAYIEEHDYRSLFKEQIEKGSFIVQILQSSFLDVKKTQAAQLSQYFKRKEVFYKNIIYKEVDSIYVILTGQIELRQQGSDKRDQSISIQSAGQFFGQEQGLGLGLKRICTAHCIANDTKVIYQSKLLK